ncbi:hypothetical protein pb186bvf_000124 [Paramecium bursaria]
MKLCLSGFEGEERVNLKHFAQKLGLVIDVGGLTFTTDALICKSVKQDKYKIAKILNIDIVSQQWILNSFNQEKLLDRKNFLLKYFKGVSLALLGFQDNEYEKLHKHIVDNEGVCDNLITKYTDIIVIRKGSPLEFDPQIRDAKLPTVDSNWIAQCIKRQCFVSYQFYDYHQPPVSKKDLMDKFQYIKIAETLDKQLDEYTYFRGLIIYIAVKDEQIAKILQSLVVAGDGLYLSTFLPNITHIVYVPGLSHKQQPNLGVSQVVHAQWLADCFQFRRRVNEVDYQVRNKDFQEEQKYSIKQEEFEVKRDKYILGTTSPIPRNKSNQQQQTEQKKGNQFGLKAANSVSFCNDIFEQAKPKIQESLIINKFSSKKSNLFISCYFFVFYYDRIDQSFLDNITYHGGAFEKHQLNNKPRQFKLNRERPNIIFLMPDCNKTNEAIIQFQKDNQLREAHYFSHRWISYCVIRNILELGVIKKLLYHLMPINQVTPNLQLKNKLYCISVKEENRKVVLQGIAEALTGVPPRYSLAEMDVFVTDHDCKKIKEIEDINQQARFENQIEIQSPDRILQIYSSH